MVCPRSCCICPWRLERGGKVTKSSYKITTLATVDKTLFIMTDIPVNELMLMGRRHTMTLLVRASVSHRFTVHTITIRPLCAARVRAGVIAESMSPWWMCVTVSRDRPSVRMTWRRSQGPSADASKSRSRPIPPGRPSQRRRCPDPGIRPTRFHWVSTYGPALSHSPRSPRDTADQTSVHALLYWLPYHAFFQCSGKKTCKTHI